MADVRLMVLYPYPTDVEQFERDYQAHRKLLHEKAQIPPQEQPYTVTRCLETPQGRPVYYQLFMMPFPSAEALQQAIAHQNCRWLPTMRCGFPQVVRPSSSSAPNLSSNGVGCSLL